MTSVTFKRVTPILRVEDIDASLAFYVEKLGFQLHWRDEDGNSFASISRDRCDFFLSVGDQGHPGSWMWIGVGDVDQLHEELLAKNVRIRQAPANFPWGLARNAGGRSGREHSSFRFREQTGRSVR
jgi:catechol 2,3-dioxygenase-like lactoylglutathione lyase family enzyme